MSSLKELNQAIDNAVYNKHIIGTESSAPPAIFHRYLLQLIASTLKANLITGGVQATVLTEVNIDDAFGKSANIDVGVFLKPIDGDTQVHAIEGKLNRAEKARAIALCANPELVILFSFKHYFSSFNKNAYNHAQNTLGEMVRYLQNSKHNFIRKGVWISLLPDYCPKKKKELWEIEQSSPVSIFTSLNSVGYKIGDQYRPFQELIYTLFLKFAIHTNIRTTLAKGCSDKKFGSIIAAIRKNKQLLGSISGAEFTQLKQAILHHIPEKWLKANSIGITRSVAAVDLSEEQSE